MVPLFAGKAAKLGLCPSASHAPYGPCTWGSTHGVRALQLSDSQRCVSMVHTLLRERLQKIYPKRLSSTRRSRSWVPGSLAFAMSVQERAGSVGTRTLVRGCIRTPKIIRSAQTRQKTDPLNGYERGPLFPPFFLFVIFHPNGQYPWFSPRQGASGGRVSLP